ncbi:MULTISPECIES: NAD(P)H-binding protein [Streptacidiphilus]|uniref:NAD(P)H-binding protein n=2 Tax=Streptacidiphilus TaxID=228398 RepID=A0ABV6UK04_9ACTN|nr:NAD(P)H-binding protein [Streptacidiphilus jeojiense]
MDNPVVVVGGAGRVGRLVAQRLLERGAAVRVVDHALQHARRHLPPGVAFTLGDVRDPAGLAEPLARCSAVVYCVDPGTADTGPDSPQSTVYQGLCNVLDAARAAGQRPHVVLISQHHATHWGHPLNAYGRVLEWRLAGEEALRESGLPYTVIRPGWLTDGAAGLRVRLAQGDRGNGQVSRQDVAEACVQALYCPSASGVTFEMFNETGVAPSHWEGLFAALEWDQVPVA